jgi:hypothetical protein
LRKRFQKYFETIKIPHFLSTNILLLKSIFIIDNDSFLLGITIHEVEKYCGNLTVFVREDVLGKELESFHQEHRELTGDGFAR